MGDEFMTELDLNNIVLSIVIPYLLSYNPGKMGINRYISILP